MLPDETLLPEEYLSLLEESLSDESLSREGELLSKDPPPPEEPVFRPKDVLPEEPPPTVGDLSSFLSGLLGFDGFVSPNDELCELLLEEPLALPDDTLPFEDPVFRFEELSCAELPLPEDPLLEDPFDGEELLPPEAPFDDEELP